MLWVEIADLWEKHKYLPLAEGGDGMAARLTDKQKKKIVADYIQLGSYSAAARANGVSHQTVKNVVMKSDDIYRKLQQKKEENTADIIAYMDGQKNDVCAVLKLGIKLLKNPDILIDKYTAHSGDNIADDQSEDALSKSLRELGEGLESDGD